MFVFWCATKLATVTPHLVAESMQISIINLSLLLRINKYHQTIQAEIKIIHAFLGLFNFK